jgi:hypothetical protein
MRTGFAHPTGLDSCLHLAVAESSDGMVGQLAWRAGFGWERRGMAVTGPPFSATVKRTTTMWVATVEG